MDKEILSIKEKLEIRKQKKLEYHRKYQKKYREGHKEERSEYMKEYRKRDEYKKQYKKYWRKWYLRNREIVLEKHKEYNRKKKIANM